jgi:hypothetical protein
MRTITDTMLERLKMQTKEAKVLGLVKTASNLEREVNAYEKNTRADDSFYSYASKDVESDVQKHLWDAIVRVADFYGANFDADVIQSTVEKMSESLIEEFKKDAGVSHGVGAYESTVPGEVREHIAIEIKE